ncbi:MAG: beta-L-arabinofuranosidase domain-containing protein [Verrucomicrobiota bacterium]
MNQPIPFTEVRIDDSFWNERLRINREVSLPYQYWQCKETGRIDAFKLLWQPGTGSAPNIAWDSDVAKWVEAASYSLATHPDADLAAQLEEVVALIASAQQPDGYLNTHFTQVDQEKRWENLQDAHELYCAGHLIEAAVAHFQATGKRDLLDVACRYADYISTVFGREEGEIHGYCGHEEIELALVKLYRATREKRYLELSRYFVEERGRSPHIFKNPRDAWGGLAYYQAHAPVREQKEAVGHAVRAVYLYSAIADLAGESNDPSLLAASETLWESVTKRKMYLTGGIGSTRAGEAFTNDYDLPDETAYCETCAAVGMVMWSHRLVQLDCDRRYADVMERALYNGVLSGVSRDGTKFFYENPLASRGGHHRQPWFECVCCPSNLSRLLASLGNYLFSKTDDGLAVHLYLQSGMARQSVAGASVQVKVETRYPWEGLIRLTVETDHPADFALRLRIPEWCRSHKVRIGGKSVEVSEEKGYAVIHRTWSSGDAVELVLDMPVEKIVSHPGVLMNQGQVALQRGPLVYCVEDANHKIGVFNLVLPGDAKLSPRWEQNLLGGITVVEGKGLIRTPSENLYSRADDVTFAETDLLAVPYYAWDNQTPGAMTVWMPVPVSFQN